MSDQLSAEQLATLRGLIALQPPTDGRWPHSSPTPGASRSPARRTDWPTSGASSASRRPPPSHRTRPGTRSTRSTAPGADLPQGWGITTAAARRLNRRARATLHPSPPPNSPATMNDTEADAIVQALLRRIPGEKGTPPLQDRGAIGETFLAYLHSQAGRVSPRHHVDTKRRLNLILRDQAARAALQGHRLDFLSDLSVPLLQEFADDRLGKGRAPATVRMELSAIQTVVRWAMKRRIIESDPLVGLELPKVGRKHQTAPRARYSLDQAAMLVAVALREDERRLHSKAGGVHRWQIPQAPALLILLRTGIRLGELCGLIWGDLLHLPDGPALRVRAETAKDGEDSYAPVATELHAVLIQLRDTHGREHRLTVTDSLPMLRSPQGAQLSDRNFYRQFERWRTTAGIPKRNERGESFCVHSLRHVVGDEVARVNVRAAQLLLGHAKSSTTENYLHTDGLEFVRAAMESTPQMDVAGALRALGMSDPGHYPARQAGAKNGPLGGGEGSGERTRTSDSRIMIPLL